MGIIVQVVMGGADAFDALVYGSQHPANTNYFQRQIENVSNVLTDIGQTFFANTRALYDQVNSSEVMRIARAAVQTAKGLFKPNCVLSIFDITEMQNAQPVMQRYIMANPVVRELYHKQQCDGFSDTYVDVSPGVIGEQHYDYRRVMNSVIQETDDSWIVKFYPDEIFDGDKELTHDEKVDIISTWKIAEMFVMAGKQDPTSPYNSNL